MYRRSAASSTPIPGALGQEGGRPLIAPTPARIDLADAVRRQPTDAGRITTGNPVHGRGLEPYGTFMARHPLSAADNKENADGENSGKPPHE